MKKYGLSAQILAWSVHLFTASGVLFAFLALLAVHQKDFKMAMIWLIVTIIVDGVDGTFARLFKVKEVLPNFDGNSIDHVIDFLTYAIIPAFFIYQSDLVSVSEFWKMMAIVFILLSSTYYYGKTTYVTEDLHFEGFPVMWNAVAFYLFFIGKFDTWTNFTVIVVISILHFIPWKYPYPSRTKEFRGLNIAVSLITIVFGFLILYIYPTTSQWMMMVGNACVLYFFGMTIFKTFFYKKRTI